jgi:hypothetical protein
MMNKHINSLVKEYPIGDLITKVHDNNDDMVASLSADLARVCNILYPKLYTSPTPDEQRRICYVELLSFVPSKISPYGSNFMVQLHGPWYKPTLGIQGIKVPRLMDPQGCDDLCNIVGANQPLHWFIGGNDLGIQQGTSVWVGLPKSCNKRLSNLFYKV